MKRLVSLLRPHGAPPPRLTLSAIALATLGAGIAIGILAFASGFTQVPLVLGSFGASCVLVFGYPESPFSQPRSVIGGHVVASACGLACLALFGPVWWSMALAAAFAVAAMHLTRTVHPPAGSNPVIVMLAVPNWHFLLTPTLAGAVLLVAVALCFHALVKGRKWPRYWV